MTPTRYGRRMRLLYVLDCADPEVLADFWTEAMGFRRPGSTRRTCGCPTRRAGGPTCC